MPPRQSGSRLQAFVVIVLLLFLLAIFIVVALPVLDGTHDAVMQTDHGAIKETGMADSLSFTLDVGMILVPMIFGIGIVAFTYAVVAGKGSFRGGR